MNSLDKKIKGIVIPLTACIILCMALIFVPERISYVVGLFKPFFGALFIAYLLDSFVRFLCEKTKAKRGIAVLIVYLVILSILALFLYKVIPTIVSSVNEIVSFATNPNSALSFMDFIEDKFNHEIVQDLIAWLQQFSSEIRSFINKALIYISNALVNIAGGIATSLVPIFSTFILSIYMLLEKEDLLARSRRFIFAFFNDPKANYIMGVFRHGNRIFKSFLVGKIIDSAVVGVIAILVFTVLGVPNAVLMGTIIGFSNIIPYFGPIIGAVPVVTIVLFMNPSKALVALIAILLIGQLDGNFIDPKIVGKNTGVSAFWTITSVSIGGAAFGFIGVVLSVPTVVLIKTVIEEAVANKLAAKGMADMDMEHIKIIGKEKENKESFFDKFKRK